MALQRGGLLWLGLLSGVFGQEPSSTITATGSDTTTAGSATTEAATPTGSYLSLTSQSSLATSSTTNTTRSRLSTATSDLLTLLTGGGTSYAGNATATSSAGPEVTNTRPCNNYPEFCLRKYSNITEVGCHNSPFITPNNLAANQQYDVTQQLNDGVRFLQGQIQWPQNDTKPHFCHTSCDIIDAGPITDWLTQVKNWVATHPYDVVTILLGNGNYSKPSVYAPYIESTGILRYIYTPPYAPMQLDDWPTLSEMILKGQRVVMFLDYQANQTAYPWLQDEFSNMWETPFDPTNKSFPCTPQRPPKLSKKNAQNRLYLHNHNLNVELSALGSALLVPARTELDITNNATGYGSLGSAAEGCRNDWGFPPKVLNVDYYNFGSYPGSVFEVQAKMNGVQYNRTCCGQTTSAGSRSLSYGFWSMLFAPAVGSFLLLV